MERLGNKLAGLIRRLGLEDAAKLQGIKARWSELVGPQLSEHLEPGFVSGATLHITASSPLWLEQAGFYREEILKRLAPLGVRDIKFKPGALPGKFSRKSPGKTGRSFTPSDEPSAESLTLTDDEARQVEIALYPIRDGELKELCRGIMSKAISRDQKK